MRMGLPLPSRGSRTAIQPHTHQVSKTTDKPIPGYLNPREFTTATARVVYEPPLAPGVLIRLGPDSTLEERTLRYEHAQTGEPTEMVLPEAEVVAIAGLDEFEEQKFNDATCRYEPTGKMIPYAYSLWETEQPPAIGDWGQYRDYCEAEGHDPDTYAWTEAGSRWLTGGHKVGDRRMFIIGSGQFHAALIGGEWIPVVYETVRTQVKPVLGWAVESAAQTSFKGAEQFKGHRRIARDKKGRLVRESDVVRRRWTTTLAVDALAELDRISAETGQHRNEIVEALILGNATPATATPEPEPAAPEPSSKKGKPLGPRKLSKADSEALNHRLLELIQLGRADGATLRDVAQVMGMEINAIQQRVSRLRRRQG
jgi:hypothetical protein